MKTLFFSAVMLVAGINLAQEKDPKAKGILDELSTKTKSYQSIKADFTIELEGKDKKKESSEGKILIKGDKFRLEIKNQTIFCDGKVQTTYLKTSNEATIDTYDPKANDGITPSNVFTIYESGFKYKYNSEEVVNGVTIQIIDMYPLNPDKKKYHTIKFMVDKAKKQVYGVKMLMKDGGTQTILIKYFTPNAPTQDGDFIFDKTKYPKPPTVTDLRE